MSLKAEDTFDSRWLAFSWHEREIIAQCCLHALPVFHTMNLAELAENPLFIILCYVFSFGPWAFLFRDDFISRNWGTIRDTRRMGLTHLWLSIVTLAAVLLYLAAQQQAGDYKEMMAASLAVSVALYHISRTVCGLVQLQAYQSWCEQTVAYLRKINCLDQVCPNKLHESDDWKHLRLTKIAFALNNQTGEDLPFESGSFRGSLEDKRVSTVLDMSQEKNEKEEEQLQDIMMVNNQVVDNELFSSEMPVRLRLPPCGFRQALRNANKLRFDDWLCSKDLVRCSLRWTIALLSNFGREWLHINKSTIYIDDSQDLHLPFGVKVPEDFHHVLRAQRSALAMDLFFYNDGLLDEIDTTLGNDESEVKLMERRMDALRHMNTDQVLLFLSLVAKQGKGR